MTLTRRITLLNLTIIILLLAAFLVTAVYAGTPTDNYAELKKIQHLNSDNNRLFVAHLLSQVDAQEYVSLRAPIYAYIAKLKTNDGNWRDGKNYLNRAILALDQVKNDSLLIDSFEHISWIFFIRGDYSEDIFYLEKMAELAYKTGNISGQIVASNRLALSYIELELFALATQPLQTALDLARKTKNFDYEFLTILYLVNTRINLNNVNPQEILKLTQVAEGISSKFNNNDGRLLRLKGIIHQQIGDFEAAKHWLILAQKQAKFNHDLRLLQMVSKNLSAIYLVTNQPLLALDYALASLDYNNQMAHSKTRVSIHYLLSKIYQQLGDESNSVKYLRAYADFEYSASHKKRVSLITTMDQHIKNIKRGQKLAELKDSLLINKVTAEENKNKQQLSVFIIILLGLAFCFVIIVFFVHHRMLKAQVLSSMKDELTGLFCRSYLKSYLPAVQSRYERETDNTLSLGVLIIDCDDFKFINDTFGHAGGDKALKAIVNNIITQIREHDLLLRWGGDEFVLICESVSQIQMSELAKRIIRSISDLLIVYDEATLLVTVSAGYALHDKAEKFNFHGLIKAADKLLLATKKSGKNNYLGTEASDLNTHGCTNNFS
jgi:diguanylate cyclase (GGDEF)-like protein